MSVLARSFLIQASWNYHNMIGNGFAFAMLPALRELFGRDPKELDASVRRHLDHFNAHPYLSGLALGATVRLEGDGVDPETVRRFKTAVRGPLGGLGDSLVWATWLPTVSMLALVGWWFGMPVWATVAGFMMVYNAGHLGLRFWGFHSGLHEGQGVAQALRRANLSLVGARLQSLTSLILGVLVGAVLSDKGGLADSGALWGVLGAVAFVVGLKIGHRVWRPAAIAVVTTVVLLSTWGVIR
jgi:mannose PTS system EIID component